LYEFDGEIVAHHRLFHGGRMPMKRLGSMCVHHALRREQEEKVRPNNQNVYQEWRSSSVQHGRPRKTKMSVAFASL
jgi:hypothetical protein